MSELKERLKNLIIDALQLEDVTPADLDDQEPLMDSGLGLDSIDALELVVRVEKEFGIKIKNSEEAREALGSINTLATFIESRQAASA
ncbi:phosphopantetheine-binding protein [Cerasicoccus maritimus]|uniref:phosphopantetheine-binding protein n=1 Tax=Cerasicoccus maritimus TaxID=490089 RepID=UPI002852A806|nr:phosphopantetheine-binding protein [Cerasicoccus maritimus]